MPILPIRAVHPIVEAIGETVGSVLRIAGTTIRTNPLLRVRAQVVVSVTAIPEVGRLGDQHAALYNGQRARHDQTVEEDRGTVGAAITVSVLEHDNAAQRVSFAATFKVAHVTLILDYPDAPVGV